MQQCAKCGAQNLQSNRLGTAEAVAELQRIVPNAAIAKFDRDSVTTQKKLNELLEKFNDRAIDILVGTQMLSKGHDYHDVTLAVVIGIDNILAQPDYRSRERSLSLLLQIAGRSGRKKDANVIVQTFNKEFFESYLNDYETFLQDEELFRRGMYPPYKKLCRLLYADAKEVKAKEAMRQAVEALQSFSGVEVVGHGEAPIKRIASKYRFVILLRSDKSTELIRAVTYVKSTMCEVDMDPVEFS